MILSCFFFSKLSVFCRLVLLTPYFPPPLFLFVCSRIRAMWWVFHRVYSSVYLFQTRFDF